MVDRPFKLLLRIAIETWGVFLDKAVYDGCEEGGREVRAMGTELG